VEWGEHPLAPLLAVAKSVESEGKLNRSGQGLHVSVIKRKLMMRMMGLGIRV